MEPGDFPSQDYRDASRPSWTTLVRYLTGEATPDECARVEQWGASDPHRHAALPAIRMWWAQDPEVVNTDQAAAVETQLALAAVRRKTRPSHAPDDGQDLGPAGVARKSMSAGSRGPRSDVDTGSSVGRVARRREEHSSPRPLWRGMRSAAAMAVIAVGLVVLGGRVVWRRGSQGTTPSMLTYTTGNGERARITLPDGGTVALNVASRLEVPMDYMAGDHTVRLTGEGLFTVSHHDRVPLVVRAGAATVRVLGTSFAVRRYAMDTATMVAVKNGKVAVGRTVVTAAQAVDVGRAGVSPIRAADASAFSFATGVLTLRDLPLPAAIAELDRWFDTDVRLGTPELARYRLSGEFTAGSLADLAEDLELSLAVRVVREGRTLTIYPR